MKKIIAICLLAGVVGCEAKEKGGESPAVKNQSPATAAAQNETPEPPATKKDPSTLVNAIRGKRVHFEISGPDKKKYQAWLQIAEGDQLSTGVGTRHQTITFHSKGYSLFTVAPSDGDTVELRFTKGKLSPADPVQSIEHTHGVDLQTILASTDNSTELDSGPAVILKIEDAQPLEKQPAEKNSPN